jgi:Icc-related predicted phosphoesterase
MASIAALPDVTDLHLTAVTAHGFRFAGIGGAIMLPLRSRIAFREKRLLTAAAALVDSRTILVVHPPPFGFRDRVLGRIHAGAAGVAKLMYQCQPLLVICGHIHEAAGIRQTAGTTVVNCSMGAGGGGALIRLSSVTGPEVTFP